MADLYDIATIKKILGAHGFTFSKALGQNFLVDPDVCPEMVRQSGVDEKTGVLEIGPGIGVLTKELALAAGKVVAIELDQRLPAVLKETLGEFQNVTVIQGDVLKMDLAALIREHFSGMRVMVCANLPYYITSPILMYLLESRLPIESITVMVQKEAGARLTAAVGSRAGGAVTVAVDYYARAEHLFDVGKEAFFPSPKVDSAVISLKIREAPAIRLQDEKGFFRLVKAAFGQRRKTALNAVSAGLSLPKPQVAEALEKAGLPLDIRAEKITMEQFAALSNLLFPV